MFDFLSNFVYVPVWLFALLLVLAGVAGEHALVGAVRLVLRIGARRQVKPRRAARVEWRIAGANRDSTNAGFLTPKDETGDRPHIILLDDVRLREAAGK